MHPEEINPTPDQLDREIAELLREADDLRRPDRRAPRGNQVADADDVERGREKLDQVL